MSDKIQAIIDFANRHVIPLNLPEIEGAEQLTAEEEIDFYNAIGEKLDMLFQGGETASGKKISQSCFFKLDDLKSLLSEDNRIAQHKKWNDNLNRVLNNYGRGTKDKNYLISIGDPKLGIYTTAKQLNYELDTLRFVNHKFPNASVKVDKMYVERELNKKELVKDNKTGEEVWQQTYATMSEEQRNGVYACTMTDSIVSSLQGFAGAGKSYTMGAVSKIYNAMGYNVMGVTLSWKAADVLGAESEMPCITVAQILTDLRKKQKMGKPLFRKPTVIIVDEAGLVGLGQMHDLLEFISQSTVPVKLILSGDSTQLNPIGEANSLSLIEKVIDENAKATISEIRRQNSASHRQSVLNFKDGISGEGIYTYLQQESITIADDHHELRKELLNDYFNSAVAAPKRTRLILCQGNSTVNDFNEQIHIMLQDLGQVDRTNHPLLVKDNDKNNRTGVKTINLSVGDKVFFTANFKNILLRNKETGKLHKDGNAFALNKQQGTITSIQGGINDGYVIHMEIPVLDKDENGKTVSVMTEAIFNTKTDLRDPQSFAACLDLNYAISIYSSQGQTVDETYIVNSTNIDCRNAYVALSRHRGDAKIYVDKQPMLHSILGKRKKNDDGENNQHKEEFYLSNKNINSLHILNEMSQYWSRNIQQDSVVMKFLKMYEYMNNIAVKNKIPMDFNNLSHTLMNLKKIEDNEESIREIDKTFVRPLSSSEQMDKLMDSAEFYVPKTPNVDFNQVRQDSFLKEFIRNNPETRNDYIPLKQRTSYLLHENITPEFFKKFDGKLLSIGRGSELRILGTTEDDTVYSKYDIFGKDGLGIGYPVMAHSGLHTSNSEVYIIQDLNLYFDYLSKYYLHEDANQVSEDKPILIWGAKTTDYSHIAHSLENKNIHLLGNEVFQYNTFFRITQSIDGLQLKANFANIDGLIIQDLYLPQDGQVFDETRVHKMPVNNKKFGMYCNPESLKNITYQNDFWSDMIDDFKLTNGSEIKKSQYIYDPKPNPTPLVDEYGCFSMEFIHEYINRKGLMLKDGKMDNDRFEKQVLQRANSVKSFINFKSEKAIELNNMRLAHEKALKQEQEAAHESERRANVLQALQAQGRRSSPTVH